VSKREHRRISWAYWLAFAWVVFTTSLVCWWWIHGLRQAEFIRSHLAEQRPGSARRMMEWEGAVLVATVALGGVALITLVARERRRHEQMRLFFSNFAHDLNTSMTRLRLQGELLREKKEGFEPFLDSLTRLELRLENSLWLAREENQPFLREELRLSDLVSGLRMDCPELEIRISREATLRADSAALKSVFRNLVNNSLIHGEANLVEIAVEENGPGRLAIRLSDNGIGFTGARDQLGHTLLQPKAGHGNGLGLYLSRRILARMNGELEILQPATGFQLRITLPGAVG
jgi:signal transduction histidine kinase